MIDPEKDYLVLTREEDGMLRCFEWYSADKFSLTEVEEKIAIANKNNNRPKGSGRFFELETNPQAKEIAAYCERSRSLECLISDAAEVQDNINEAVESLENAIEELNRIRGLDRRGLY